MKVEKILEPGDVFGEIGLITEGTLQATAVCSEECHFMIAEKPQFLKIFGKFF